MQDTLEHLWSYVLGIWRHRWLALIVVWVLSVAGWTFVSRMPESYVATARVYVDTTSMLGPLMRGLTVNENPNQRIAMMSRTLLSRPNLERLARMTDLDVEAVTEAEQQSLIASLENSISLSGNRGNESLYSITVTHRDRETARRLTESLITVFIEESMSDQNTDSSEAQSFLDQQIAESELRLVEAENGLADFKRDNASMLPGDTGDYYQRLQQARSALQDAELELRELENRRENLDRQLEGEEPVFIAGGSQGLGQSTGITSLDQRIQVLQLELNALLVRYTDQHPEVRRLRSLLTELEAERLSAYGNAAEQPGTGLYSSLSESPVYQGLRTLLAETRAQAAAVQARVAEYQNRVTELESMVNQIPDVEAQLVQLNRGYEVIQNQHRQLLQRRESARLSEDLQRNTGDVSFRVVDPPFVPLNPSNPNKPLFNAGVLVASLGSGGALALLLALVNPIVTDTRSLAQSTGLPILGAVTFQKGSAQIRSERRGQAAFVACGFGLLLAFGAVMTMPLLIT